MAEEGPIANYGYTDASGEYYLTVYAARCNGCGQCVEACPNKILEIYEDDWGDILVKVKDEYTRKIGYICKTCKAGFQPQPPPCIQTCETDAIVHSW